MISPSQDLMSALLGEDDLAASGAAPGSAVRSRRGRVDDGLLPAPYPEGNDEDEELYWNYTSAWWEEQDAPMEHLVRAWIQNILFLLGLQWHDRNDLSGGYERQRGPKWKEYPVTNLCLPFYKHTVAKLTKNRPAWITKPASTDPEDIESAELGAQALEAKWTELRMARVLRRMSAWLVTTGNAYLLPYWSTQTGRMRPLTMPVESIRHNAETGQPEGFEIIEVPCRLNPETGEPEPILDEQGNYDMEAEPEFYDEGDLGCRLLSPFQVRVDAGADNDEDVSTVVIVEPITVRDLQRRYGLERTEGITGEDTSTLDHVENLMSGLYAAGADTHIVSGGGASRAEALPKVRLFHHYEKQSEQYRQGRYWAVAAGRLMEDPQPLPDQIWPPMVHLVDVEVPGRYHGMATMEAVVGLNREYNEVNGKIKEHHNLMLRGKWLVPIGSGIRRGALTGEPGEVIQHTPNLPPKMADLKPLPAEVYRERERILNDFQLVSGINKISMGQAPPGVTAGRAFLVLQESDDTDIGPLVQMVEEAIAELAWKFLQLMQANYTDERLIHIVGENNRFKVRSFTGAQLGGIIDVIPQTGSAFPWNQVARQSMLIELMQLAPDLFMDDETGRLDRGKLARLLPSAGLDSLSQEADVDLTEAQRQEDDIFGGADDLMPLPWQNLVVHTRQHATTLKSATFAAWPPDRQQQLIQHWMSDNAQLNAMRQMAMLQMAAEQQQAGAGGGPPAGGGGAASPADPGMAPAMSPEEQIDAAARELTEGKSVHRTAEQPVG